MIQTELIGVEEDFEYATGCKAECQSEGTCKTLGLSEKCVKCKANCEVSKKAEEDKRKQAILYAIKEPIAGEGGMGLGTIIAIAVVALLVIGLILYFVLRKKK